MAKLTIEVMRERTMDAIAGHADPQTVAIIGQFLNTNRIAALLQVHRQVPKETSHRWWNREALTNDERRDLIHDIHTAWQRCIDAKLAPWIVLTHSRILEEVATAKASEAAEKISLRTPPHKPHSHRLALGRPVCNLHVPIPQSS